MSKKREEKYGIEFKNALEREVRVWYPRPLLRLNEIYIEWEGRMQFVSIRQRRNIGHKKSLICQNVVEIEFLLPTQEILRPTQKFLRRTQDFFLPT